MKRPRSEWRSFEGTALVLRHVRGGSWRARLFPDGEIVSLAPGGLTVDSGFAPGRFFRISGLTLTTPKRTIVTVHAATRVAGEGLEGSEGRHEVKKSEVPKIRVRLASTLSPGVMVARDGEDYTLILSAGVVPEVDVTEAATARIRALQTEIDERERERVFLMDFRRAMGTGKVEVKR